MKFESQNGAASAESVPILAYLEDESLVFDYTL